MKVIVEVSRKGSGYFIQAEITYTGKTYFREEYTVEGATIGGMTPLNRVSNIVAGIAMRSVDVYRTERGKHESSSKNGVTRRESAGEKIA